ncbi:MAG: ABC transporter ATP-binding protein [Acutalibacteraceae bacterium]
MSEKKAPVQGQKRPKAKKGTLKRLIKMLFEFYPVLTPVIIVCIIFSSIVSSIPALFIQKVTASIGEFVSTRDWNVAKQQIIPEVMILLSLYIVSVLAIALYTQLAAILTQGYLNKMRKKMFGGMQDLPISYFDRNKKGDIMSHYTNDIDAIRQLISQALPSLLMASVIVVTVFAIMLSFSVWITLLIICGVALMFVVSKVFGGGSAKYFIRQQKSMGKTEGFVQEMMNGQKVVKVFCHEEDSQRDFDEINDALFHDSYKANAYASMLGPVVMNIGNILYVLVAIFGGLLITLNVPNLALNPEYRGAIGAAGMITLLVPFLNMTKQFTGNINQVSQQINSVVMALAGAERVFALMDNPPEEDNGYVTLVNAEISEDGTITESDKRTGHWAWRHPHTADGTVTYTLLRGDLRMENVDFSYVEGKPVLHDITVYAEPGQKVAFVGATGAGKTTITNLVNRFYDIEEGKIRYDGININKIKKSDLRRSLGLVLQETNLFTGTVMDNIRYGRLEATDEECIEAAKLSGADDFITRLPEGYDTMLKNNGANLSQGQRQLIAIARAAVADPPCLILDEATSSIDTHTEAIVQKGMDKLMDGRTVFVIAHRLSTVVNSDVIMVLDGGRIIERGSHEKLIAEKGVYYQLYTGAFELE